MKYAMCSLKQIVISVIVVIIFSSACKTADADNAVQKNGSWTYEIETTLPGTKSEGQWGHLYYKGKEVPPVFELMLVNNTLYIYRIRELAWKFGGYEKQATAESKIVESSEKIATAEMEKGWYRAARDQWKTGTPSTWIWTKRDELKAFLDPAKMDLFVSHNKLKPLVPGNMLKSKINKNK
ncbi:MAG: hypothetical protein JW822_08275 [Spirochaetales bacterium]|nr:hypothetical protein [Spirochaetales bacterium]